ncbi:MAG: hypothetical protein JSS55_06565 [Proteobacteria bacterium]|nr:hypothetical protein [Pseudomonadota bacterium]
MTETPLRVRIVLSPDNASWILEKMAHRLADGAAAGNVMADVAPVPDPSADLNHWMSYAFANERHSTPASMTITHLDDPYKIKMVDRLLRGSVNLGICLSSDHARYLAEQGVPADRLAYAVPGHDFVASPRRIVIGITTRLYRDGRKREAMLSELARQVDLAPFRFDIFGSGWDSVIGQLQAGGAEVRYFPGTEDFVADYQAIAEALPHFDYYLYLGRDEGSLGTLDALAAGVKTIVTPQGFHCDLPGGITHPVWTQDDLNQVFRRLAGEVRSLTAAAAAFSWAAYAQAHCRLWSDVVNGRPIEQPVPAQPCTIAPRRESRRDVVLRQFSPFRIRSALSHIPVLKPVRRWFLRR